MPIELLHRGQPDKIESSPGKNPELLVGKASKLWRLIAPEREPNLKSQVASLLFRYEEKILPIPQSPEIVLLKSLMEPYLLSENAGGNTFHLMLGINPAWYNHPEKTSGSGEPSFAIRVNAPSRLTPPVEVMNISEIPGSKGVLGLFATGYDITVEKGKKPLGGIYHPMQKPMIYATSDELGRAELDYSKALYESLNPGAVILENVEWRNNFVSEVLAMFIAMAKDISPEKAAQMDRDRQKLISAHGIK